jgi:hypothetical protein
MNDDQNFDSKIINNSITYEKEILRFIKYLYIFLFRNFTEVEKIMHSNGIYENPLNYLGPYVTGIY